MARTFIRQYQPGITIENEVFVLAEKDLRTTATGSLYIHAVLSDKSGTVPARMWQASQELYNLLPLDGFVRVRGRTENYKSALQFIIEGIEPVTPDAKINVDDFLPCTDKDVEQMAKRLLEILRTIKDKPLLFLVKQFVDDKELMARFKRAPAAVAMHHACLGGLLEHTLNILELALLITPRYPEVNLDLMLVGCFLHDIGKTSEFAWDTSLKYTDPGQLIGHLVIGSMLVEQKAQLAARDLGQPFPARTIQLLEHMIVSHHGEYEFGAAKLPMTTEAILLHYLDDLDAKMDMAKRELSQTEPNSDWTKYIRSIERKLFKTVNGGPAPK